ncbi:hypothetical protein THIOM_003428, partial [Candidatus Thiomargarita nelsonii]
MFKALRKSIVLVVLFLVNMALFTLCINQLMESEQTLSVKKTPIDVQAKVPQDVMTVASPTGYSARPNESKQTQHPKAKQQLALVFNATHIHLNQAETVKL